MADSGARGRKKRLAVFVSGGGSNMRAIHAATLTGHLSASVEVLPSSSPLSKWFPGRLRSDIPGRRWNGSLVLPLPLMIRLTPKTLPGRGSRSQPSATEVCLPFGMVRLRSMTCAAGDVLRARALSR